MQLGAAGSVVESGTSGIGPAVAVVEAQGAFIGVENPQTGVGEAAGPESVEGGGVELGADAAAPDIGGEVERVEIAEGGVGAVGGYERRTGRGEADDGAGDRCDDDASMGEARWPRRRGVMVFNARCGGRRLKGTSFY